MFTPADLKQIEDHGLSVGGVERQIENFRRGFPSLSVVRAASPGDGIVVLDRAALAEAVARYEREAAALRIVKFVPASGAATRMFKEPYEFINEGKRGKGIDTLLGNLERFAFWPELRRLLGDSADDCTKVARIVDDEGLGYGSKPKGLVAFHRYGEEVRKAVEEHLVEGAQYAASKGCVQLHFTVSPEHRAEFARVLEERIPLYERRFGVRYRIDFSVQKPSTDTIAVSPDFTPFRTDDGRLLFRPAGHGALIENLAEIDADLVFIKNIDNVTTDARRADTILYKKALGGILLAAQREIFALLDELDRGLCDGEAAVRFLRERLCVELPEGADEQTVRRLLDRPLRVCGMVRNQGEPGGGPFWVRSDDGSRQLQIAESSQIAQRDMHLMKDATHFNPVDLVCGLKNRRGERYDLRRFTDPATGFVSEKSSGGRPLLAQELPGLWNGAMARWNTIFVDVPVATFSPVKVVNDLLRAEHQPL